MDTMQCVMSLTNGRGMYFSVHYQPQNDGVHLPYVTNYYNENATGNEASANDIYHKYTSEDQLESVIEGFFYYDNYRTVLRNDGDFGHLIDDEDEIDPYCPAPTVDVTTAPGDV